MVVRQGEHRFDFAWGHGGQLIVLLDEFDIIIGTTADPLYHLPETKGWLYEGAIIDLVGRFIDSLPKGKASGRKKLCRHPIWLGEPATL